MKNTRRNIVRILAIVLVAATLSLALCSCGKNISEVEVIKSDHFSVSAGMITYSLYDSYYYYVNRFGADGLKLYLGIDTTVSLKNQYYDAAKTKTWFDVFKSEAVDGFRNSLALCEAAYADGITLTEIDKKFIQNEMDEIAAIGAKENKTLAEYIEYIYTDGVTEEDVRRSLEIFRLANKKRYKDFHDAEVTESEIKSDLEKNADTYLQRDIIYFEFIMSNESSKNPAIKEFAEKAKGAKNEEEFRAFVAEYLASDVCTDKEGKVGSKTVQNNVDEKEKNVIDKWLFNENAPTGSTYLYESGTSYGVYMVMTDAAMDESETRDIYTILFSSDIYNSDEESKAKAEAVYKEWVDGGKDIGKFKELAIKYTTDYPSVFTGGLYENVLDDDLTEALDKWLFDEARVPGDSDIIKTEYGYHIILYSGAGEPAWKVPVIEGIKETKTTAMVQSYVELYTVTVIQGNMKYVKGE